MRAVLFVLIAATLVVIAGVGSGFINVNEIHGAKAPEVTATGNGVTAKGGEGSAFDVETGSVKVGTEETTLKVPTLEVQKPGQARVTATANKAM